MTMEQMGEACGVSAPAYYYWESGKTKIDDDIIELIAKALDCDKYEFYSSDWKLRLKGIEDVVDTLIDDYDIDILEKLPELRQWVSLAFQHGLIDLSDAEDKVKKDLSDIFPFIRKKEDEDTDK